MLFLALPAFYIALTVALGTGVKSTVGVAGIAFAVLFLPQVLGGLLPIVERALADVDRGLGLAGRQGPAGVDPHADRMGDLDDRADRRGEGGVRPPGALARPSSHPRRTAAWGRRPAFEFADAAARPSTARTRGDRHRRSSGPAMPARAGSGCSHARPSPACTSAPRGNPGNVVRACPRTVSVAAPMSVATAPRRVGTSTIDRQGAARCPPPRRQRGASNIRRREPAPAASAPSLPSPA